MTALWRDGFHASGPVATAMQNARERSDAMDDAAISDDRFERGLATRRAVLGSDYVDNAIRNADDFNRPLQEWITQSCWNDVWNRPGLDRRTRSLLNLAMLTALNRPHELKLHLLGALNNGVTREEIREVFLQAAVYCGAPAAVDSFRTAKDVFREVDAEAARAG
jgi:4-carboxymuconolactone decarboxylase